MSQKPEESVTAGAGADAPDIHVQLLVSPGCHLCEVAREALEQVLAPWGLDYEEVDVTQEEALLTRYFAEIPVVMVNGVPRDFWQVDKPRLERILRGLSTGVDPEEIG